MEYINVYLFQRIQDIVRHVILGHDMINCGPITGPMSRHVVPEQDMVRHVVLKLDMVRHVVLE